MTRAEKKQIDVLAPGVVRRDPSHGPVFLTDPSTGACVLRSARGCEIHARHGEEEKPGGCRRFPFGLVATPAGGRLTTQHRCPCRSVGDRPAIDPAVAELSVRDCAGRLQADGRVSGTMKLDRGRRVSFVTYLALESMHLEALLAGADPEETLGEQALSGLSAARWSELAEELESDPDDTAYSVAERWFAWALRSALRPGHGFVPPSTRPWAPSYDRACVRSGARTAVETFADWMSDVIWSLDWYFVSDRADESPTGSYAQGCRELLTRHAAAREISAYLMDQGLDEGRAAAEAITVVELAGQGSVWQAALCRL